MRLSPTLALGMPILSASAFRCAKISLGLEPKGRPSCTHSTAARCSFLECIHTHFGIHSGTRIPALALQFLILTATRITRWRS